MKKFSEITKRLGTDKYDHGYSDHYERHLKGFSGTLLEIGIHEGASIKAWSEFLPKAKIIGIEINDHTKEEYIVPDATYIYGDGTKPETFAGLSPDVVVDDGSHKANDILATFNILWDRLPSGGWYIIEDLDVQFEPRWQGSEAGSPATKVIVDKLFNLFREAGYQLSEFHAYKQIVFMRKK